MKNNTTLRKYRIRPEWRAGLITIYSVLSASNCFKTVGDLFSGKQNRSNLARHKLMITVLSFTGMKGAEEFVKYRNMTIKAVKYYHCQNLNMLLNRKGKFLQKKPGQQISKN